MLNTKVWRPQMERLHPYHSLSLGKADNWRNVSSHKERKDTKWISETKCIFDYLLSLPLKLKARLKDVQFIFYFFIALLFCLLCITYIFVLSFVTINNFIWINTLLLTSETVNCIGSFLHILLPITFDRHLVLKPGEVLMLYPNAVFFNIQRNIQSTSLFYPARLLLTTTHNVGWNTLSQN